MGLSMVKSCYKQGYRYDEDPIATRFRIVNMYSVNGHTLAHINYPNCTNFEGNKYILFKDTSIKEIEQMGEIDPHFQQGSNIIARLEPTPMGWNLGVAMMNILDLNFILDK